MTYSEITKKLNAGYVITKRFWPKYTFWFKLNDKLFEFGNLNENPFAVPNYGIKEVDCREIPTENNSDNNWTWGRKIENYSYLQKFLVGIAD